MGLLLASAKQCCYQQLSNCRFEHHSIAVPNGT